MDTLAQSNEQDVNVNGVIPAGFLFASVKNVGNNPATVNDVTLPPGEAKSYPFVGKGQTAVAYQTNGSTLRIMTII